MRIARLLRPTGLVVSIALAVVLAVVAGASLATPLTRGTTADGAQTGSTPGPGPAALRHVGERDGWSRYLLAENRVPDGLAPGAGFRGQLEWVQNGLLRRARVTIPAGLSQEAPLLVTLAGYNGSLDSAERQQRWAPVTEQSGAVLAEAAAADGAWNAGRCCKRGVTEDIDDVGYLDRLVEIVTALQEVDPRRVYFAGFSNGAMMAYRYACARPGRVAALVSVAGTMVSWCVPRFPTAVLAVNGTSDRTVPIEGGVNTILSTTLPPTARGPELFARAGAVVRTVVVPKLGHSWPTAAQGFDATAQGWAFLLAHPRPVAVRQDRGGATAQ